MNKFFRAKYKLRSTLSVNNRRLISETYNVYNTTICLYKNIISIILTRIIYFATLGYVRKLCLFILKLFSFTCNTFKLLCVPIFNTNFGAFYKLIKYPIVMISLGKSTTHLQLNLHFKHQNLVEEPLLSVSIFLQNYVMYIII